MCCVSYRNLMHSANRAHLSRLRRSVFSTPRFKTVGDQIRRGNPYLGDSVGVGAIGDLGRTRAVRLVRSNDLGGVGHIGGSRVGRVAGRDASDEGSSSKSELHFA